MLHIKCEKCGSTLKGGEITITPFNAYVNGVKYKDYAAACPNCGGIVIHERYVKKAQDNKAHALAKLSRKKGKSIKELTEEQKYDAIIRKIGTAAKETALKEKGNPIVNLRSLYAEIGKLPKEDIDTMLAYEDKLDMALLKKEYVKSTKQVSVSAVLLLTQAIIESAIIEKDYDFFQSQYGEQVVDTYNTALTNHTKKDYGITAELLLEKMRKGTIKVRGEREDV